MDLSDSEIRVLGCLLEKQRTTPDHYPLSLNSLRLACNQATNREPVVRYDDAIVRDALHRLERRGYTRLAGASRAAKYRHLLSEALPMSDAEQAIVCVLMLRGPQTPGELKQRGERIHAFPTLEGVQETLAALIDRGLVARLQRRPGQKEERYSHKLGDTSTESGNGSRSSSTTHTVGDVRNTAAAAASGSPAAAASGFPAAAASDSRMASSPQLGSSLREDLGSRPGSSAAAGSSAPTEDLGDRVARLEREVAELRAALIQS